jgi:diguanylate cyclase (GGDEF)-like protein
MPATLVVDDPELAGRLRAALGERVVAVDHYLEAIGQMAHRPVEMVVGGVEAMGEQMESTIRAMRRVAPEARLVICAQADHEPLAIRAVRLGADEYLVKPVDAGRVMTMLGVATPRASGEAAPGAGPTDEAGLIEQMMQDRRGVLEAAMSVLRARTGASGAAWSNEPGADGASVPVRHGDQTLGHIVCDPARVAAVREQAAWLGRWIALDRHVAQLQELALRDPLTGVWNRRYFDRFLIARLRQARQDRFRVTVMLYDIDDFKFYNDRFGHAAGDDILIEAARLMQSVVRKHDVVARVGGDEFAVIFWDAEAPRRPDSEHPQSVRRAAERFQRAICEHRFPKLGEQAPDTLTISGGLASFPWDGASPQELLQVADQMLMESKKTGKNALTFGPGAMRMCGLDQPKQSGSRRAGE